MEVMRTLAHIWAFRDLPADTIAALDRSCQWRTYAPDSIVIDYQELSTDVFFVVRGHVRVVIMSVGGRTTAFRELGPGDMFGELAAIDGKPRSASIETLESCLIGQIKAETFNELITREPTAMRAVLLYLVGLVRGVSERYYELSALGVSSRLHAELMRLALAGQVHGSRASITLPTHAELASRIGTHREAVTRELNKLEREKVILREGSVTLIDLVLLDGLVRAAKGDGDPAIARA